MPLARCSCPTHARRLSETSRRFGATPTHVVTVECHDPDGKLEALLDYIKTIGNTGHSFNIVVDPEANGGKRFDWDGDGSDSIQAVRTTEVG